MAPLPANLLSAPLAPTSCSHLLSPPLVPTSAPTSCSHLLFPPLAPTSSAHRVFTLMFPLLVPTSCPRLLLPPIASTFCSPYRSHSLSPPLVPLAIVSSSTPLHTHYAHLPPSLSPCLSSSPPLFFTPTPSSHSIVILTSLLAYPSLLFLVTLNPHSQHSLSSSPLPLLHNLFITDHLLPPTTTYYLLLPITY